MAVLLASALRLNSSHTFGMLRIQPLRAVSKSLAIYEL